MNIGWQQEVNVAPPLNETSSKAPGPVFARPQYLVHVGKKCVDWPLRQRRETGYRSTFRFRVASAWVPRCRVLCPLFLAVCDPTCGFALPRFYSRLPRTLRSQFQGQSPNSSMFFRLRAVSFEPTCTNTILCRVQITITRYCGLFELS